jgi:hypothetical protein
VARSARQLTLLGLEPEALPSDEPTSAAEKLPVDDRQGLLFADRVALLRDLDAAIAAGDFAEALRLRRVHEETYGPVGREELAFLERLASDDQTVGDRLAIWSEIDVGLSSRPGLRLRVRRGVFSRLLSRHTPEEILAAAPDCLPSLVAVIGHGGTARRLVRDALLSGWTLHPRDIEGDEPLHRLLLDHDLPPRWLACHGAILRLWPTPRAPDAEIAAFAARGHGGAADYDREPATAFWECLRVAETPGRPEAVLLEARRWMKLLNGELHALYMRRERAD